MTLYLHDRVILVVNGESYATPFVALAEKKSLGFSFKKNLIFENPERVALVVFTGGEDVSPFMYGKLPHRSTSNSVIRDKEELAIFLKASDHKIPMAGICRGSQFLCVMAGGDLVQDITGHGRDHQLLVEVKGQKKSVLVNSSHHQMQLPFYKLEEGTDYKLIGYMEKPISRHYALDDQTVIPVERADSKLKLEPDIVYYPKIKALAAQYHPEWLNEDHEGFILYQELLEEYIEPLIHDQARTTTA